MQPQSRADQFEPNWRHFHPQSTVWVQNPYDEDIIFYVADEMNQQYKYKMPGLKVSELPGGAVATLGVKEIVDRMIQNNKDEILRIWDKEVRSKYEDRIIVKIKEAPLTSERTVAGEINLGSSEETVAEDFAEEAPVEEEQAFPTTDIDTKKADSKEKKADPAAKAAAAAALASLPKSSTVEA
jgi:hypothetical protein